MAPLLWGAVVVVLAAVLIIGVAHGVWLLVLAASLLLALVLASIGWAVWTGWRSVRGDGGAM